MSLTQMYRNATMPKDKAKLPNSNEFKHCCEQPNIMLTEIKEPRFRCLHCGEYHNTPTDIKD